MAKKIHKVNDIEKTAVQQIYHSGQIQTTFKLTKFLAHLTKVEMNLYNHELPVVVVIVVSVGVDVYEQSLLLSTILERKLSNFVERLIMVTHRKTFKLLSHY